MYDAAGQVEDLESPADEADVRGYVFGFLQLLNSVSSQCGLGEYQKRLAHASHQVALIFSCHQGYALSSLLMYSGHSCNKRQATHI